MIRLSVLDQSTVVTGRSPDASIRESIRLAQHAEALGYDRYWCAEHHNSDSQAGTAPEILIAAIAATTKSIRVGSAGVMLPHYSALKVAEQFRVLDAIAPGRIDLGLGRAPGSDGRTAYALNPQAETAADNFPAQVRDLRSWIAGERLVENHPFREIRAQPQGPTRPAIWSAAGRVTTMRFVPRRRVTRSALSSSRNASRIVERLTANCSASSVSGGSESPSRSVRSRIRAAIAVATRR